MSVMAPVTIRGKVLEVPVIQGGMGVGISLSSLAGSVMKEGAMGTISAAHPGYRKPNFRQNPLLANCEALAEECAQARALSQGKGLLAINVMAAAREYEAIVRCAAKAKPDVIVSGAGLPLDLPKYVEDPEIALAVIVSSKKAAELICKAWSVRHHRLPDFIVVEGSEAGGHLGFSKDQMAAHSAQSLAEIVTEVVQVTHHYAELFETTIPVFAGGGIFDHADVMEILAAGASGVQLGTRFIPTVECDAADAFKQMIIASKQSDIELVHSPAGFPGRALVNPFVKRVRERGNVSVPNCLKCLTPCNPLDTPYCISEALIQSAKGNVDYGLVFVGSNAYRITHMTTVHDVIEQLLGKQEVNA